MSSSSSLSFSAMWCASGAGARSSGAPFPCGSISSSGPGAGASGFFFLGAAALGFAFAGLLAGRALAFLAPGRGFAVLAFPLPLIGEGLAAAVFFAPPLFAGVAAFLRAGAFDPDLAVALGLAFDFAARFAFAGFCF